MNLKKLNDQELHESGKRSVENEREATTQVLHHLMEINRRKLFSAMGYKSLHEYAEKEYKYPGDQAYRRIAAMKLLKELPEIEEKITQGELSLTHLSEAKKLFKRKFCSRSEKLELFEKLSNTTTREAQKIMVQIAPEIATHEKVRLVSEDAMEFRFTGSLVLDSKLKELKNRMVHTHPHISMGELIEKLADQALEKLKEERELKAKPQIIRNEEKSTSSSKAEVLRQVWARDQHQCVNCKSTYALEIDHKIPKAKGGPDSFDNLRLLCRNCNQRSAIEHYGLKKMDHYLKSPLTKYDFQPR